jgi:hypothetical protein
MAMKVALSEYTPASCSSWLLSQLPGFFTLDKASPWAVPCHVQLASHLPSVYGWLARLVLKLQVIKSPPSLHISNDTVPHPLTTPLAAGKYT